MKTSNLAKFIALSLAIIMLVMMLPLSTIAASIKYDDNHGGTNYYQLISKRDWGLAPGIEETEVVLNNADGTRRQVVHTVKIDMNNPYTKVIPGYKGMIPTAGNYGTESTSAQALNAEKLGYGNVVAATNAMLSWYSSAYYKAHPELIGEPLGYNILNGYYYENSQGKLGLMSGSYAVVVINYDYHPLTGEKRPDDMPKVQMRYMSDPLTGWEENALSVWSFLVRPDENGKPVNQYGVDHGSGVASRTFVGITAEGEIILSVSDGEQAPYSTGFTMHEMGDYMIKMGCIYAANCDGGGSTTFCTQRPGEDLKVNCSLSDGGERPTTNTFLVISTAPADGTFVRATIESEYNYYTPGSTVSFEALGTDAVGTKVEIPDDVQWRVKEDGMGTIANGVFTSNGTVGTVTAQMIYNNEVVGERQITIAVPDRIFFEQPVVTIPFGKTARIPLKATANIGGVNFEIGLGENDITFATDNAQLGTFEGLSFIAIDEENAPAVTTGTLSATLNMGTNPTTTVELKLGRASHVIWDFEGGQTDIDEWNVINNRKGTHWDYDLRLSLADRTNGQVHDGNYSMRLETNGIHSKDSHSKQYAWIRLGVDGEALILENARSFGFWLYVPEDNIQCWVQAHYMTDSNGDGIFDTENVVSLMESENVYYNIDESGWHYLSMDISAFEKVALKASQQFDKDPSDGASGEKGEFFLAFVFHKAINNKLWQENGSINGPYTYYLDNFTVDYSEAVDDRENPEIGKIYLDGTTALIKRDVVVTTSNILNLSAEVADASTKLDANKNEVPLYNASGLNPNSAKVYIDGVEVPSSLSGGVLSATDIAVADGYHRVKFEICDNAGNKSVVIRIVKVEAGTSDSTLKFVPADTTLDRIPFGSIYWMNLEANSIETIQTVSTVIDLNNVNHWELEHMELAEGFTAEYTIAAETNTATITITRTGDNTQTGTAVLAKIPIRIIYFDTDILVPGYTAETYWTTYEFWPQDMKLDVDMGLITHVDGTTSTFSNEEFHVDTEMYTHKDGIDKAYFAEHGTTHVHTPVAIVDKQPTCVENGYIGRTFCEKCNSVVEWGTTIPATGHAYKVVGNTLCCDCGSKFKGTGLQIANGKNYYTINGKLLGGWQTVNGNWYYFDENDNYAGIDGKHTIGGIEYNFDKGLVEGVWKNDGVGTRYYYGPSYYYLEGRSQLSNYIWATIHGETYAFDRNGHRYEGLAVLTTSGGISTLYEFTDEGVLVGIYKTDYTGIFVCRKTTTYLKDGAPFAAGLVKEGDDYYYIDSGCTAVTGNYEITRTNQLLMPGFYQFGHDGKMINPPIYNDGPNRNGYFYLNGLKQKCYKLIGFNDEYYFINDNDKYARNIVIYLGGAFVSGTGLNPGFYYFDSEGKLSIKNGPNEDGYFYLNGVRQSCYQLIEYNGNYYFINDAHKYAKDRTIYLGAEYLTETALPVGLYYFDVTGKMVIKNGPDADGYFYLNGIRQKAYQIIKFEGSYYFIYDENKYARNKYIDVLGEFLEGTDLRRWYYDFDNEGKMIGYYEGLPNGRDIGDIWYLKTEDGKDIKSGLLIRGGELDNANYYYPENILQIGIERLKNEFNIKFDMDLRSPTVIGLPLFGDAVVHKTYNMAMYDQVFTEEGKAKVKEVFTDLANPDNYPIYLHCTHGIDRTGTVCFILEMVLGVPLNRLCNEYMLSVGANGGSILKVYYGINNGYTGKTLKDKAEAYLKDCGITQEQIDSLRAIYLGD